MTYHVFGMTLYNVSARRRVMDAQGRAIWTQGFPCLPEDCYSKCELNCKTVDPLKIPDDQKKHVLNFKIIKDGFGSILFEGTTDVSELDLIYKNKKGEPKSQITWEGVQGECTGVSLYPDDETKPKVGTQLNKRAIITLDFLKGFDANAIEEDIAGDGDGDGDGDDGATKPKPRFISYSTDTGKLQFEVQHFSRYGLSEKVTKLLQAGQDRR
jgi:hypothetical protein